MSCPRGDARAAAGPTADDTAPDVSAPVARQLAAYNAHDLEGFCACYADDVELYRIHESVPYSSGMPALRDLYRARFSNPDLKARIAHRIVKGSHVVDHEVVSGLGPEDIEVVAIYEVGDGLIRRVIFIR